MTSFTTKPATSAAAKTTPVVDALRRPLHDLRISLLDQCNFRCPYCMPEAQYHADYEFLRRQQRLTYEEILRVASAAVGLGVSKIRLTGGEPLLDKNLPALIEGIVQLPGLDDLALTTNGMLLAPVAAIPRCRRAAPGDCQSR